MLFSHMMYNKAQLCTCFHWCCAPSLDATASHPCCCGCPHYPALNPAPQVLA